MSLTKHDELDAILDGGRLCYELFGYLLAHVYVQVHNKHALLGNLRVGGKL